MSAEQRQGRRFTCTWVGDDATLSVAGRGAVANVFRLDDPADDAGVSLGLKVVRGALRQRADVREMLGQEFERLRKLDHPRIPTAYALLSWHQRATLLFDFVPGQTLLTHLSQRQLSPAESRRYAIDLLDILRYLHTQEPAIVHGDLSPENLIIADDGSLHLVDFGSAIADSLRGAAPGKPSYLSPEQAQGRTWSTRSDLYQAGIVLFEMLSGRRYNPGASPLARRAFAANPDIDLDSFIDIPFRPIVRRLLDPDPTARWPNAAACLGALERLRPGRDGDSVDAPELHPSAQKLS